jgi:hypothetical protein
MTTQPITDALHTAVNAIFEAEDAGVLTPHDADAVRSLTLAALDRLAVAALNGVDR